MRTAEAIERNGVGIPGASVENTIPWRGKAEAERGVAMRKLIRAIIIVVGIVVLIVVAVGTYAVLNLNGIIQKQRGLILAKASDAAGRKVDVQDIHASLGWGVVADLRGVTVADDPAFSQTPFVQAADVYARVALLPLLSHRVEIKQIALKQPVVHIIRNQRGILNVSSIGKKSSTGETVVPPPSAAPPTAGTAPLKGVPLTRRSPKLGKTRVRERLARCRFRALPSRTPLSFTRTRAPRR